MDTSLLYYKYPDGRNIVEEFFSTMIAFRSDRIIQYLELIKNRQGVGASEDIFCQFYDDFLDEEKEIFDESYILITAYFPLVDDDCAVGIKFKDFFTEFSLSLSQYEDNFPIDYYNDICEHLADVASLF